jgi:predicted esterase
MLKTELSISKTARAFMTEAPNQATNHIWIVLHGYGQLADRFLSRFSQFASNERAFIAPEGLHRFYLDGSSGKIGASWMTREDREKDISDNIEWLNQLYANLCISPHTKKHLLGFSQGAATAVRWFCSNRFEIDSLCLWAGSFPPDVSIEINKERFAQTKLFTIHGSRDPIVSTEQMSVLHEMMLVHSVDFKTIQYDGGHQIDALPISDLLNAAEN